MKKNWPAIILILLIAVVVFVVSRFFEKEKVSKDIVSIEKHYGLKKGEAKLFIDTAESDEAILVEDERAYISFEFAKSFVSRLFYEPENETVIFTDAKSKVVYFLDSEKRLENKKEVEGEYIPFISHKDEVFVALDFLQEKTGVVYSLEKKPYRVMLFTKTKEYEKAQTVKEAILRTEADNMAPILKELKEKTEVYFIKTEDESKFDYVLTEDGILGYVNKKHLDSFKKEKMEVNPVNQDEDYSSIQKKDAIVLAWHQVFNERANFELDAVLKGTKGVTVLSPTWFSIIREDGELESLASKEYVKKAHEKGMEVWALVNDFNNKVDFYELFMKEKNRETLIENLVYFIDEYDLDGINIDFEMIKSDYAEGYVQFLREFSIVMREKKKVFSIDNYVPASHTDFYNRKEQGIVADYVCVMAYDEHYFGSKEAGSVSSVSWVRRGIDLTGEEVKQEKLIIGLPFYTRIWKEKASGGMETRALNMEQGLKRVKAAGVESVWDEKTGQYYAEWKDGKDTYKIWLEEKRSIAEKLAQVDKSKVAGIAFWKLGLEKENVWDVIEDWVSN